jgi:sulfur dioxygenase
LKVVYTLDSHNHAEHMTAARRLKMAVGSRIAHPAFVHLECVESP